MCGIVGYVGERSASVILLDGLKRLEYRGYDSSGLAILDGGKISLRRSVGKISQLEEEIKKNPLKGFMGLGHTRWATHGIPSEENAHPHTDCSKQIVVVHNGIIENYTKLKTNLAKNGHRFVSQTDTEVIAHLIEDHWPKKRNGAKAVVTEKDLLRMVRGALARLEGAYALGILFADFSDLLIAARKDCPLVLGVGKRENFIASDIPALLPYTRHAIFLDQKEMAVLKKNKIECFSESGEPIHKSAVTVNLDPVQAEKAPYKHFMLKEIMEQPNAIEDTLRGRLFASSKELNLGIDLDAKFIRDLNRITLVACGTSYHAALVGRFWIESLAGLPCQVEIASEFRYRRSFLTKRDLAIYISQSGETADTLAALRISKSTGARSLAICNVLGSSLTNEAEAVFYTHCGPEIGVASTKAFTGQLTALLLIAVYIATIRKALDSNQIEKILEQLVKLPGWVRETLKVIKKVEMISQKYYQSRNFLFLGRNLNYPIALEGALKLKEISYIHAEGYPAGEMKHGPIALIDKEMPIVAIATQSAVYEKICSNVEEAIARGGNVVALVSSGDSAMNEKANEVIVVPVVPEIFSPMINVIPLQMLAYAIAVLRGCDVDQPRNLAKSVTVE